MQGLLPPSRITTSTYLDVKERIPLIEFSFDGASPPGAGTNTGKYGFVHTTGGTYTAGQIVYDDGATLAVIPMYKMMMLSSSATVTGTISLIANGVYQLTSVPPTYTWILKGDGTATGVGLVQLIEVTFSYTDMGTDVDSTTVIPNGARVLRTGLRVDTPFSGGATPAAAVKVNGSSPLTILGTTESNLEAGNQYENDSYVDIGASETGVVRVTLTGTATAGAGVAFVEYATPFV